MDSDDNKEVKLNDKGIYLLTGNITQCSCSDAIKFILEKNYKKKKPKSLTLLISSPGGCVYSGFGLIDVMLNSKIPVKTIGVGVIASMGLLIFMAGQKKYRTITPNTSIMSHQWWSVSWGKSHELFAAQKEYEITEEMIMRHYKKFTGLSEKKIKEVLLPPHDVWLKPEEAKKYGIVDRISKI